MRREGRQHGMVRTYMIIPSPLNPLATPRFVNQIDSPPAAGVFTKVSTRPTNHSKSTGRCTKTKCSEWYVHPVCKSKVKAKGSQRFRSAGDDGLGFCGISAMKSLDHLDGDGMDGGDYDYELEGEDD